jgi:choline dehydrogenase-like flavoprotein
MSTMNYVIGSGPSGVACASALLQRGRRVVMIDAGITIETRRAAAVSCFLSGPARACPDTAPWLAESDAEAQHKIPRRLLFGSDFAFQGAEEHLNIDSDGVGLQPSLATGGLSNVWGAAVLPYAEADIEDWPIGAGELRPHREACLNLLGVSAAEDDLAALLPLDAPAQNCLALSAQADALRKSLHRNRDALRREGIHYGQARIAVETPAADGRSGCIYCGMCLSGCPYDKIYCSTRSLADFRRNANFVHETDIVIVSVMEAVDKVVARGYRRLTREPVEFQADRMFLACGVIPTTRILLKSRDLFDQPTVVKDSQYFLLPVFLHTRVVDVRAERLHALSQLFIEISDNDISPHLVHLQVYSYNRLISAKLRATFGALAKSAPGLIRAAENRLMLIQGYLHSRHSSAITATLRRDGRFEMRAKINPETRRIVKRVARKLLRQAGRLGVTPILPLLEIAEPGRGFHAGGTFPMRLNPGPLESDLLGRPFGWKILHAIDATVLPSIPATTITLSVMANAHRIASQATLLDGANV